MPAENTPHHLVQDPALALDMAHAEKPYRELSLHAKELGLVAVSSEMEDRAAMASEEVQVSSATEEQIQNEESRESFMNRQEVGQLIKEAPVIAGTWMAGKGIPNERQTRFGDRFKALFSEHFSKEFTQSFDEELKNHTASALMESYNQNLIPELITFQKTDWKANQITGSSASDTEKIVLVMYETATRTQGPSQYASEYRDLMGRPGNYLTYHMFLSESKAKQLREVIENEPEIVHEMSDMVMQGKFGVSDEEWEKIRTPYAKWQELNGGVHRVAVRDSLQTPPDQAEVLEFK